MNMAESLEWKIMRLESKIEDQQEAIQRVREVFSKEIEYNLESDYERAVLDVKKLVLRALDGEQQ